MGGKRVSQGEKTGVRGRRERQRGEGNARKKKQQGKVKLILRQKFTFLALKFTPIYIRK